MKAVAVLLLTWFAGVLTSSDSVWMELVSAQIEESERTIIKDSKNIPELAKDLDLNVLVKLVAKAGLVDKLSGKGPFTVFGPTDSAFKDLPKKFVDILVNNVTMLTDVLEYHVLRGDVFSKDLKDEELVPTVQGKDIRINIYNKSDETVVITASGRRVIKPDQRASNGVIHVVNSVLFPPAGTLTDVVVKCPAFSTLLTAVKAAGLADTLAGAGPFTLFAPSNAAFGKIPDECLKALLKDKKKLTEVLTYHVVPSTQYSAGLSCGDKLKTVQGGEVKITLWKGVYVNWSKVTFADITVTNGVMHSIDKVLWPKDEAEQFCATVMNTTKDEEIDILKSLYNL